MRFTITVPDDLNAQIEDICSERGISKSAWTVANLAEAVNRITGPGDGPADADADAIRAALEARDEAIAAVAVVRADLAAVTAERDALEHRVIAAEAIAAERADHIENLLRSLAAVESMSRRTIAGPADQDQGEPRPGPLSRFRAWLSR